MERAKALRDEGAALFVDGKFADAQPKFRQSLDALAPLVAETEGRSALQLSCWLNISSCCVKLSQYDVAVDAATQALSIDKKNCKAYFRRGQAYLASNMISKARVDLMIASELSNGDPAIEAELARLRAEATRAAPISTAASTKTGLRDFSPKGGAAEDMDDGLDSLLEEYGSGSGEPKLGLRSGAAVENLYRQLQQLDRGGGALGRGGFGGDSVGLESLLASLRGSLGGMPRMGPTSAPGSSSAEAAESALGPAEIPPQLSSLHQRAEGGDGEAMLELGDHFENGTGGAMKHPRESFRWYLKASESGLPKGHSYAAWCYRNGFGTPKDLVKAVSLYKNAASAGVTKAQACLGYLFEKGEGVSVDLAEAAKYYLMAAEAGDATSQVNLGLLYEKGHGVSKQDFAEALRWFTAAAEQGNLSACVNVGLAYEKGQGTPKDMPTAFQWYQKAATAGDHTAQAIVGCCYEKGLGVAANREVAQMWYVRSAEQGNGHAREGLKRLMGLDSRQ